MNRLSKRVEDLERKTPDTVEPPRIERVIIGQNEAGEWIEKRIVEEGQEK
ncbi:hypothetical protein ROJ8625_00932 [Roseivivax jejudonensis]|uniref:Uncharacterized protein n=1 Tax=Roseivivax jejudonensis TaxID=1529041 RepID=A0A1X6YJW4_9RHOB|nr:hypothetical protein [Roseivivax jejudonensis]SLN23279.1 hypothetical protein ROJ8625_00932 [Roseivivax jejudonensis]